MGSSRKQTGGEWRPLDVVRAARGRVPYVFHRTPEETLVGLGEAFVATGGHSLAKARERVCRELDGLSANEREMLRLYFEVGFDPTSESDELWDDFAQLRVVCPQISLRWHEGELTVVRMKGGEEVESVLEEAQETNRETSGGSRRDVNVEWPDVTAYRSAVEEAAQTDAAEKVVVARRAVVSGDEPIEPGDALEALASRYGSSRLFAISPSASTDSPVFLGASPERLVRVDGNRAETMALAGTAERDGDRGGEELGRELLESAKDRDEHGYVVEMIAETLSGKGASVEVADEPRTIVLPNVVHLETPISATDPEGLDIVELVDALHPTPAVCGTPTGAAREMIRECEPFERGLYTGALGWTTLDGDGDATVALRCGLLRGARADLFAGGGITADSDVDAEEAETESKLAPVLRALSSETPTGGRR